MKTSCAGVVRMLALAALASGACACLHATPPKITINADSPPTVDGVYTTSYGDDINLHCSTTKNAENLKIHRNGKLVQTVKYINTTTVQLFTKRPKLGIYIYRCTDHKNGCEHSLMVKVLPAISVKSRRAYHKLDEGQIYVFVPFGDNYEVFCSGNDAASLRISSFGKEQLESEVINKTTINQMRLADRVYKEYYWCTAKEITVNGEQLLQEITVIVDYYPEGKHFSCFIDEWTTLVCSWNYSTDMENFKLFYKEHHDEATLLCAGPSDIKTDTCKWGITSKRFFNNGNLSLILIACNEYVCNNQTFAMSTRSIIILDSVSGLRVSEISSRDALLEWDSRFWGRSAENLDYWGHFECETCVYKVEYRMKTFREEWRRASSSSMRCDKRFCRVRLILPYPDSEYEVKVCVRFSEATNERMWSQPEAFHEIARMSTTARDECACRGAAGQQTPASAVSKASCEVCELTDDTIKRSLALKNKIRTLKEKLAKINKIAELLSVSNEIANKLNNYS